MLHAIPPTVPALIAPATASDRDQFPACRNWRAGQPRPAGCRRRAQTRLYWLSLSRPAVDPEHGPMVETMVIDAEIHAGYIPEEGGGEVTRLAILVAAEMPGWTITGLSLADEPDTEF